VKRTGIVAAAAVAAMAVPGVAMAAGWSVGSSATSAGGSKANTIAAAAAANGTTVTATTVTIAVTTKPASGPTPASYRVARTSATAPGATATACTITADAGGLGSCQDTGLTASTAYTYSVFSRIGAKWESASGLAVAGTTSAAAATIKVTGGTRSGGSGNASFNGTGAAATGTVTIAICDQAFPCTPASHVVATLTATPQSNGSFTASTSGGPLTAGSSYHVQASQGSTTGPDETFTFPTVSSAPFTAS
jgi:hypothetical protein